MKTIAVIPARLKSQRLPNKVLKKISGKSLLWHVWRQAKEAEEVEEVVIACCEDEVKKEAEDFGALVCMTDPHHESGTDRVAEAVSKIECDIVLNMQADEPLIKPETLNKIARFLTDNKECLMATAVFAMTDKSRLESPNVVKVAADKKGQAIFFSRSLIPYNRGNCPNVRYFKHIGIYGYRKNFLLEFSRLEQSPLEKIEKLEQLRAVEHGVKIKLIEIDYDTVGVDTEEDFEIVKKMMA